MPPIGDAFPCCLASTMMTGVCMWFVTMISVWKGLTSRMFSQWRWEPDKPMMAHRSVKFNGHEGVQGLFDPKSCRNLLDAASSKSETMKSMFSKSSGGVSYSHPARKKMHTFWYGQAKTSQVLQWRIGNCRGSICVPVRWRWQHVTVSSKKSPCKRKGNLTTDPIQTYTWHIVWCASFSWSVCKKDCFLEQTIFSCYLLRVSGLPKPLIPI